ncbi:MAG: hypothetical protein WA061_02330 [Microgenomates group bacterium]
MKTPYELDYIFDEPVKYKTLRLHPVRMRDYFYFFGVSDILTVDKNSIPDMNIISMSYLDYLMAYSNDENIYVQKVLGILSICTKEEDISVYKTGENKFTLNIKKETYTPNDFDEIIKIICEQNLVEVPDFSIQKEIRDRMEEGKRLKSRESGHKMAPLEDQMVSLAMATGVPIESIYNMTFRKFSKALERVDLRMHYEIYLSASMSGFVSFKDKSFIKHWLSDTEKEDTSMINVQSLENKISFKDKMNGGE